MTGEGGGFLALETATEVGSVAVGSVGRGRVEVFSRVFLLSPGEHATGLLPAVDEALRRAGVGTSELAGIVVGKGPGSFTGVRIAAATARGLAWGGRLPLWTFSSLAAAVASERDEFSPPIGEGEGSRPASGFGELDGPPRCILFDAREERVYAACYRLGPGELETLVAPHATTIPELIEAKLPDGTVFAGSGAERHRSALEGIGKLVLAAPGGTPTAEGLLRLLALSADALPEAEGSRWEPDYLRGSWTPPNRAGLGAGKGG